jgi:stage II sporulation protein D
LCGVLVHEVPVQYSKETIKTMAVIIRSYIAKKLYENGDKVVLSDKIGLPYVDLEKLKETLGEKNYAKNIKKYEEAVKDTSGEILLYNGKYVTPLYHYASAGSTRNAKEVLGETYDYMSKKESNYDIEYPGFLDVEDCLSNEFNKTVIVEQSDDSGYVLSVSVNGELMTGEQYAKRYGLNSSCFTVQYSDDNVRIITKGVGHGFGLSMYGADKMSQKGSKYIDILNYYYDNLKLVKLKE